jgi:hypothetical protein
MNWAMPDHLKGVSTMELNPWGRTCVMKRTLAFLIDRNIEPRTDLPRYYRMGQSKCLFESFRAHSFLKMGELGSLCSRALNEATNSECERARTFLVSAKVPERLRFRGVARSKACDQALYWIWREKAPLRHPR